MQGRWSQQEALSRSKGTSLEKGGVLFEHLSSDPLLRLMTMATEMGRKACCPC